MRLVLVLLIAIAVGAIPAHAGRSLTPPVIHELFTPLPCPKDPGTTLELEGCSEKATLATDRAINAQAAAIFRLLRTAVARATFIRGEQEWLRYRLDSCTAEASGYAGGSLEPVAFGECTADRNRTHLTDLAGARKALSQR